MSNVLYIGMHHDSNGSVMPNYKKIGITTDDVNNRQRSLSRTKSPIGFVMLKAWKLESDARDVERHVHLFLDEYRLAGEWFSDDEDTVTSKVISTMDC